MAVKIVLHVCRVRVDFGYEFNARLEDFCRRSFVRWLVVYVGLRKTIGDE